MQPDPDGVQIASPPALHPATVAVGFVQKLENQIRDKYMHRVICFGLLPLSLSLCVCVCVSSSLKETVTRTVNGIRQSVLDVLTLSLA